MTNRNSSEFERLRAKNHAEATKWLDSMGIKNYTVRDDLTVDVAGDVDISRDKYKLLYVFKVRFGIVTGSFLCHATGLITLEGAPVEVGGSFNCAENGLTTLRGGPLKVGSDYICHNNRLKTLTGLPDKIPGNLQCFSNQLKHLKKMPAFIGGNLVASFNPIEDFNDYGFHCAGVISVQHPYEKRLESFKGIYDSLGIIDMQFEKFKTIFAHEKLQRDLDNKSAPRKRLKL